MASPKRKKKPVGWIYALVGLVMLPWCLAVGRTLWRMIVGSPNPFQGMPGSAPAWYFSGGLIFWLFVCGFIPQPVRLYVLGHELTHALGAWLSGGAARRLRVGKRGGSVMVTRSNVFVVLAPYFVPFYAVLLLAAYFISALFIDPHPWHRWWMAALGVSWGFHLTFTVSLLGRPQRDLAVYGVFFSGVMILLFNMLALAAGLAWVTGPRLDEFADALGRETVAVYQTLFQWIGITINQALHSLTTYRP